MKVLSSAVIIALLASCGAQAAVSTVTTYAVVYQDAKATLALIDQPSPIIPPVAGSSIDVTTPQGHILGIVDKVAFVTKVTISGQVEVRQFVTTITVRQPSSLERKETESPR